MARDMHGEVRGRPIASAFQHVAICDASTKQTFVFRQA
jgi:hypothetical protein